MKLQEILNCANRHYPDGMVTAYRDEPGGEHGDGLAAFIVTELEATYTRDADTTSQIAAAMQALTRAAEELLQVANGIGDLRKGE